MQFVLVGQLRDHFKAFGPFDEEDEARTCANSLGMGDMVKWRIIPLMSPDPYSID